MFSVIFEVHPKAARWDDYMGYARLLRPELEAVDGFVDNIRYRSLTREGWLLSLSGWRDEKALVRWRTQAMHHRAQEKGREAVFHDYRLRVGQITADTRLPAGAVLREQRLDETEAGAGTAVTLADGARGAGRAEGAGPGAGPSAGQGGGGSAEEIARALGLDPGAPGLVGWDVFEAVLTPADVILLASWRDARAATAAAAGEGARLRRVRVVRDYGMFDRREAPQYYPEAARA